MEYSMYFIGTPIGNLKDITYRAVEILNSVDIIACEDTKHSVVLLNHYGIKKKLISYHKFNASSVTDEIIQLLKDGKKIALITDAGMPCISDPGNELVQKCIDEGITYTVIGGVSAVLNGLVLSGFDSSHFLFVGFLPEKNSDKQALVERFASVDAPQIYYCAPHNIIKDIEFLYSVLGDRKIAVAREISKLYESVEFTTLKEGLTTQPRGEYVLIIAPPKDVNPLNSLDIQKHLAHYVILGMDKRDAIKQVAKDRNINKNEVYKHSFDL